MPQLLRESVSQPRKSPHLHPHGQVLPFDVGRADAVRVGIASSHLGDNLDDWRLGIFCVRVMLPLLPVELYQLGEIHLGAKRFLDVTV